MFLPLFLGKSLKRINIDFLKKYLVELYSPVKPSVPRFIFFFFFNLEGLMTDWNSFVVQSLSHVQLFATTWTAARQASLSFAISWSLLKLMSIELVMPSNHLICSPLLLPPSIFPSIRVWEMSQFFASGGQRIGASASVLPVNIQDWFPLGLTSLISLHSKGISRVFSSNTVQLSL